MNITGVMGLFLELLVVKQSLSKIPEDLEGVQICRNV